jgi:adenylate cyclase
MAGTIGMAEQRVERRLAAILAGDVAGYSRLMGADEEGTLLRLNTHRREFLEPKIADHRGRIVKRTGDGVLIEFASAVDAARCAIEIQRGMVERNAPVAQGKRIELRIGIHVGDIIIENGDIFGDGVNIAARLESIAQPGGICISDDAYRHVRGKLDANFQDAGEQELKNIARPVRVYQLQQSGRAIEAPVLALPDKPSIAVLPFQNMSGDPEQEYFADGMVEEIITALSRFRQLFVIARNSSFAYKGRAVDVKLIGRELGVRYVLEGSVRKAANRLRITGQLIDAATGAHLWADRFDGQLDNVFDLQDEVTAAVVGIIAPTLEKAEIERAQRKPTENLDAYDHYLRGMVSLHHITSKEAVDEALRLLRRAIELDPAFAPAYGLAAFCFAVRKIQGRETDRTRESAEAARLARRAVELSKDDAAVLASAGYALGFVVGDLDAGIGFVDRALQLNPNLAMAWHASGWLRVWGGGKSSAAIEHFAHAMRQSPLDPFIAYAQGGTAHAHFFAGRYDEASSWARIALRELPDLIPALRIAAASDASAGRMDSATKTMARMRELDPTRSISNLRDVLGPYGPEEFAKYAEGVRKAGLPE